MEDYRKLRASSCEPRARGTQLIVKKSAEGTSFVAITQLKFMYMATELLDAAVRKSTVVSKDATRIAYEKTGKGPNLIIVNGALSYRKSKGVNELVNKLAENFTVTSYDRRGRGESGDTKPYRVEKEIDDIESLIDEAGGSSYMFGVSSGAALALYVAEKTRARKNFETRAL